MCSRGPVVAYHAFILCVIAFMADVSREHDIDLFVDLCALRV